jgi:hypothetical protein
LQSFFPSLDSNQILNEGQPLKELSYLTDYVKDKMLSEEERGPTNSKRPTSTRKSQTKNLYHHSHPNQAVAEMFSDEKNISLNFLQSSQYQQQQQQQKKQQQQQQQKYYQQPNKNNSDSIIFYDNKSYSTQRLSDFKRNFKRRITAEVEDVNVKILNRSKLNNFSETSVELTPMLLRSQKHNKTFNLKSHQDLSGVGGRSSPYTTINDNNNNNNNNNVLISDSMDQQQIQPTLMELECIAGYDGGLPQYFFLEAYDSHTRKLRLNITSALNDVPLFRIDLASEFFFYPFF